MSINNDTFEVESGQSTSLAKRNNNFLQATLQNEDNKRSLEPDSDRLKEHRSSGHATKQDSGSGITNMFVSEKPIKVI